MCVCALFAINAPYFIYNKCTSYINNPLAELI